MSQSSWESVSKLLGQEILTLDSRNWDGWLELYEADAEYWVPAWTDAGVLTTDPKSQISLIYYSSRAGLEDRVFRLRSGKSAAGNLEFRTSHFSQLLDASNEAANCTVRTNWQVNALLNNEVAMFFGSAEYLLTESASGWKIKRKKTILANDRPDTLIDFYLI